MAQARKKAPTSDPFEDAAVEAEAQVKRTIVAIARFHGWTQTELAERIQMSKASLNGKLTGSAGTKLTIGEMARIALAFGVPIEVLHLDERAAQRYVLDNEVTPMARPQKVIALAAADRRQEVKPPRVDRRRSTGQTTNFRCSPQASGGPTMTASAA